MLKQKNFHFILHCNFMSGINLQALMLFDPMNKSILTEYCSTYTVD